MNLGQQNLGIVQPQQKTGSLQSQASSTGFRFPGGNILQNAGASGLMLGQGTGVGVAQTGTLPGQMGAQAGQLQLGGLQTTGLMGQQKLGQPSGLQGGGLQIGQAGQTSGLQLGGGLQLGQVKLGQTPQGAGLQSNKPGGLQLGALQQPQGGLQLGQTQQQTTGGLQLGQMNKVGGLTSGLQAGQTSQAGGLKLGLTGGTQLGQTSGVQTGQTSLGQTGGLQLGQTAQTTGGLQLGQQTAQATGGLQLGQVQLGQTKLGTTPQTGLTGGLQLGQNQGGGLQIGKPQLQGLQNAGGLKLPQTITSSSATTNLQSTTSGLSLTQTVAPLGQQTTTIKTTTAATTVAATGGLKLGGGLPAANGLKLGTGAGGGLQLGSTSTTGGSGLGLGGLQSALQTTATSGSTAVSLGATSTTGTTAFRGLGGVDPSSTSGKGTGKDSPASVVDASLPDLLVQLVEGFKKFLKHQKENSDEISKFSDTSLKKVQQDIGTQTQVLAVASAQIKKDVQTVNFLGQETSEELRNAEVAQRTRELPAWLQKENNAPDYYFQQLVSSFEAKMELYRRQIEELESHLSAISPETGMSPQNVIEILQLQYKPFLLLAAQLQTTHEQVQVLKEQYLSYRKVFLQDSTDVFEEKRKKAKLDNGGSEAVQTGPSPFSSQMGHTTAGLANLSRNTALPSTSLHGVGLGGLTNPPSLGMGLGGLGTKLGGGTSLAATTGTLGQGLSLGSSISQPSLSLGGTAAPTINPITQKPFQLMKPPLGKRKNT